MKVTIRQKSGMNYLYADVSVSGIRCRATLGISVKDGQWKPKSQMVRGGADSETNILINDMKTGIMELVRKLQREGRLGKFEIKEGIADLRERLTNPPENIDHTIYLVEFAEKHIEESMSIRKDGTIRHYKVSLGKLKAFEKHHKEKLRFDDIDLRFYDRFIYFLQTEHKLSNNTLGTHIKNLKMWMNVSKLNGYHNQIFHESRVFKTPTEPADTIFLSEDEINKIIQTIMPYPHLENVRDLFVLACYTGVRIQDYNKLDSLHLINNGTMFKIRTEKTDTEVIIPVHPQVRRILNKYDGKPRVISNQKFNKYIKEVCRVAKIDELVKTTRTTGGQKTTTIEPKWKLVTSHCARRSFATNAYLAGLPTLAIMAITGHQTEKVFLKYVRVSKEEHARKSNQHEFFSNVS